MECRHIKGARVRTASKPHGASAFLFFIFAATLCNIRVLASGVCSGPSFPCRKGPRPAKILSYGVMP